MEIGFATPREIGEDPDAIKYQTPLSKEAIRLARHPLHNGGYGLVSAMSTRRGYCLLEKVLVVARMVTALSGMKLDGFLKELSKLTLARALNQGFEGVAGYAKGNLVDTVETSWAILVFGKNPTDKGQGTVRDKAGVTNGGTPRSTTAHQSGPLGGGTKRGAHC